MSDSDRRSPNIEDRGEAKYFHGRKGILADLRERLKWTEKDPRKGTTFLIQAAPGAGKSALLYKCAELAEGQGWETLKINTKALWDTDALCQILDGGWKHLLDEIAVNAGFDKWIQIQGAAKYKLPGHTPQSIIERGKDPLLLLLDEAQTLGRGMDPTQARYETVGVFLDSLHNGGMGRPVMLAVAGLSATKRAFKDMGVFRFKDNCYVELGPLKPEAEGEVIKDWLKKDGRAKGDPTPWMDAIMQKTHGWPQHVAAYAQAAAIHLRATGREMTPEKLKTALKVGEMKRTKFYESRAEGIVRKERQCIARAMANVEADGTIDKDIVITTLREVCSEEKAEAVFSLALSNGVFDLQGDSYVIPIPSMRRWFVANYFIE